MKHSHTYDNGSKSMVFCSDCLTQMKTFDDNAFDLAIVDPPYGIDAPLMNMGAVGKYESTATRNKKSRFSGAGKLKDRSLNKMELNWDIKPTEEYFGQLFRISKNQIIFGANYFLLPPTRGIICWDKKQPWNNFSQFELIWTSFDKPAQMLRESTRGGNNKEAKFHPTQKPVKVYEWLLENFVKPGDKVIDTHLGSGSSRIAFAKKQIEFTGFEIDEKYFNDSIARFEKAISQKELMI